MSPRVAGGRLGGEGDGGIYDDCGRGELGYCEGGAGLFYCGVDWGEGLGYEAAVGGYFEGGDFRLAGCGVGFGGVGWYGWSEDAGERLRVNDVYSVVGVSGGGGFWVGVEAEAEGNGR